MKTSARLLLCVLALALPVRAFAAADRNRPDSPPEVVHTSTGLTETGILNGASYRIDIPSNWNHSLVVYYHGYSEGVFLYRATAPLNEQTQPLYDRGYALIQSASYNFV